MWQRTWFFISWTILVFSSIGFYWVFVFVLDHGPLAVLALLVVTVTFLAKLLFLVYRRFTKGLEVSYLPLLRSGLFALVIVGTIYQIGVRNSIAHNRYTTIIAAVKEFRENTGTLPKSLNDLVPNHLNAIPLAKDSWSVLDFNRGEFRYNNGVLSYSIIPPFSELVYNFNSGNEYLVD